MPEGFSFVDAPEISPGGAQREGNMEEKQQLSLQRAMREYFDSIYLETRHIDGGKPETAMDLFGNQLSTPVMARVCPGPDGQAAAKGKAAARAGAGAWAPMEEEGEFVKITAAGAKTLALVKPYEDHKLIIAQMERAAECNAFAIGLEIDCVFGREGNPRRIKGHALGPKTLEALGQLAAASPLPFVVKGVLSQKDAYKCLEAGASGIMVSPDPLLGSRGLLPLEALPGILKVADGRIPVFVEGGITSGADVFKCLAMGAAAVCVGQVLEKPFQERGEEGFLEEINRMNAELKGIMARAGCPSLKCISKDSLWKTDSACRP